MFPVVSFETAIGVPDTVIASPAVLYCSVHHIFVQLDQTVFDVA